MTHSFFLEMGGFRYRGKIRNWTRSDEEPLGYDDLKRLVRSNRIRFPSLTQADIEDKSKADGMAKGIAILQATWFLTQCIARAAQKLPLTEVEVVTLALASLSIMMYVLWWEKPMDVRRAFYVTDQGVEVGVYPLPSTEPPESEGVSTVMPILLTDQYLCFHSCLRPLAHSAFRPHKGSARFQEEGSWSD